MRKDQKKNLKTLAKELDAAERELFLNAFYQNELPVSGKESEDATKKRVGVREVVDESESELFLRAVNEGVERAIAREKSALSSRADERRKYARKRDLIDAEIDLHGMYAEDAVTALLRFIDREKERGSKTLLVVHGKGAGILKNAVWSIIDSHPHIDDHQVAPGKFGGQGAILVRINRQSRK